MPGSQALARLLCTDDDLDATIGVRATACQPTLGEQPGQILRRLCPADVEGLLDVAL